MTATSVPADPSTSLERNAIGLPEVLFQSITHMAPAVATAIGGGRFNIWCTWIVEVCVRRTTSRPSPTKKLSCMSVAG